MDDRPYIEEPVPTRRQQDCEAELERLRAQAIQDFERWGAEKLRLEAEVERLRKGKRSDVAHNIVSIARAAIAKARQP